MKAGGVQNLVGVGVADAADEPRIGEGTLEGSVFKSERRAKAVEICRKDLDAAGIDRLKGLFAAKDVERSAALAARLGEDEGAGREVKGGEVLPACQLGLRRAPVEAASDHEMQHEPKIAVDADRDTFADAADGIARCGPRRWRAVDRQCEAEKALARRTRSIGCARMRASRAVM